MCQAPGPSLNPSPRGARFACLHVVIFMHVYMRSLSAADVVHTHSLSVQMDGCTAGHPEPAACPLSKAAGLTRRVRFVVCQMAV